MKKITFFLCAMLLFSGAFNSVDATLIEYFVSGSMSYHTSGSLPDDLGLDGAGFTLSTVADTNSIPSFDSGPPDWAFYVTTYLPVNSTLTLSGTMAGAYDGIYTAEHGFVQLDRGVMGDRVYISYSGKIDSRNTHMEAYMYS